MDYKTAYLRLFNGVTDVIEQLQKLQQQAEETVTAKEGPPLKLEDDTAE